MNVRTLENFTSSAVAVIRDNGHPIGHTKRPETHPGDYLVEVHLAFVDALKNPMSANDVRSWKALAHDVENLYRAIPVHVAPVLELEPYTSCAHMVESVLKHGVLYVNDLAHDHPYWSERENFRFRAVHDWYGHITGTLAAGRAGRFEFNAVGEINAYHLHANLHVSQEALPALFCEIVGQLAWQHATGDFPDQACAVIPPPFGATYRDTAIALFGGNV